MTIRWKAVEQYFSVALFVILEDLSVLDLALSGVKGLRKQTTESTKEPYFSVQKID